MQGSTYRRTILNVGCTNLNPQPKEKQRMFYTAITRASELLILYNV
jgi:ATP-dependent exoDNAse (exonuclease V) alpha subunit